MRIIRHIAILLLAVIALTGCTRNNGNIGKQFGQWKLVSISIDGVDHPDYKGNIYWSFQGSTIEMKEVDADNVVYQTFGNYRIEDNTLFLSFPDETFPPRPVTGLPRDAELQIIKLTGNEMILSYGDPATIYTFHKW